MTREESASDAAPQSEQQASSREEESAKRKSLYSSWAVKPEGSSQVPLPEPRKLSEAEAAAAAEAERQSGLSGASAWNHAGTFEERSHRAWAKQRLGELLRDQQEGGVTLAEVSSVTGDCNTYFVRGQKRCGFDLEISCSWRCQLELPGRSQRTVKGSVKLLNAASDDLDDLELNAEIGAKDGKAAAEEAEALRRVRALLPFFRAKLQQLLADLKAK